MPNPLPWSHSALEDFVNCPKAYSEKRVFKTVKEAQSEQMAYGNYVHKAFEDRIKSGKDLPDDLASHEGFMKSLHSTQGELFAERKVALDKQGKPCSFFDKNVWFRCVVDYTAIKTTSALVVDYKTGKKHSKFNQLKLCALWIFAEEPEVDKVVTKYYWTKTKDTTGATYTRDQIPELWKAFLPDLRQYVEAFKTDTWQPRPSGLCYGWCPVTDCGHWKPKKVKY